FCAIERVDARYVGGAADEKERNEVALGQLRVVRLERCLERVRRPFERQRDLVPPYARDRAQVEKWLDAVGIGEVDRSALLQPVAIAAEEKRASFAERRASSHRRAGWRADDAQVAADGEASHVVVDDQVVAGHDAKIEA